MNPTWTDASNWLDLLDHIWIGLVVIATAVIPTLMVARNHKKLGEIKDQVVNGHERPLRSDLDRAIEAIEQLSHDIGAVRRAELMEEDQRRSQIDDLRNDVDRMRRRP